MQYLKLNRMDFHGLAAAVLERGGVLRFEARGCSMRPFIHDGEVLLVQPGLPIRRGDVALCRIGGQRLVAHRVVRVRRSCDQVFLCVQGDACAGPDGEIAPADALGRVVAVERAGRAVRLDAGWRRWLGLAWVGLSPFSRWLYRNAAAARYRLRLRWSPV